MNRNIVPNTGPILHLYEAGLLDALRWARHVLIPEAVHLELQSLLPDWQPPPWLNVTALDATHSAEAEDWQKAGLLDWGEAEAIALARMIHADWFLTDDAAARLVATEFGLEVHGSLGVVLWCAAMGLWGRSESERALLALDDSSLWISPRVLLKARKALDDMFLAMTKESSDE